MNAQEIKKEIAALEKNTLVPEKLKTACIAKLKNDLEAIEGKTPAALATVPPKKAAPKKAAKVKVSKPKKKKSAQEHIHKTSGKKLKEVDCDELLKEYRDRQAKSKKSAKKYRTKSTIEKVSGNVITGVKQAFNAIPAAKLHNDPEKYIKMLKKVKEETRSFLGKLKEIMGDEYKATEVNEELKELADIISALEKKYAD